LTKTILIVDDNKDIGRALVLLLGAAGRSAVWVEGGSEALEWLKVHRPSLIILDLHMPGMSGMTVLRKIKENDEFKHIQVVMYSADSTESLRTEAMLLGAIDFIGKGLISIDLLVRKFCHLAESPLDVVLERASVVNLSRLTG
jgi:CheY-like chemotaxis protein